MNPIEYITKTCIKIDVSIEKYLRVNKFGVKIKSGIEKYRLVTPFRPIACAICKGNLPSINACWRIVSLGNVISNQSNRSDGIVPKLRNLIHKNNPNKKITRIRILFRIFPILLSGKYIKELISIKVLS
jgi:hypothetical protein